MELLYKCLLSKPMALDLEWKNKQIQKKMYLSSDQNDNFMLEKNSEYLLCDSLFSSTLDISWKDGQTVQGLADSALGRESGIWWEVCSKCPSQPFC